MLASGENELITQVGPGTPIGDLLRRYWVPPCLSVELPDPGGSPLRVRLLGETSSPSGTGRARSGSSRRPARTGVPPSTSDVTTTAGCDASTTILEAGEDWRSLSTRDGPVVQAAEGLIPRH